MSADFVNDRPGSGLPTRVEGEPFKSEGKVMVNAGWLAVYGKEAESDDTPSLVPVKTGEDGKLFGSVGSADVATALHAQFGVEIERRAIEIPLVESRVIKGRVIEVRWWRRRRE